MTISGEWTLLDRIKSTLTQKGVVPEDMPLAIGDDCAVYRISSDCHGLFTTDISIEKTHFDFTYCSYYETGFKAMASNVSDICAMGGEARFAFVSLGIPEHSNDSDIDQLYEGMTEALKETHAIIAGGDISKSEIFVINIALYGETRGIEPVLRSTARVDDYIYVTGTLGDSHAGLEILKKDDPKLRQTYEKLVQKHKTPASTAAIVKEIIKEYSPTAMIDISDGLSSDMNHLCSASSLGCVIDSNSLPFSDKLQHYCVTIGEDPVKYALQSGEEYELLFTSTHEIPKKEISSIPVTRIGKMIEKGMYIDYNGEQKPMENKGFSHY